MTADAKLPRYDLSKALELRDQLTCSFKSLANRVVDSSVLDELVENSLLHLPKRTPRFAVRDYLRTFMGRTISAADLRQAAWQLAGNASTIADGCSIASVTPTTISGIGWVPVEILRMWPIKRGKIVLYELRVVALAGAASGMELDTYWPQKFVPVVALNIGFTPKFNKRPLHDPAELVGLWFYTKFKPNKMGDGVTIEGIKCSTVCQSHNREIIDLRKRITDCPSRFTHPCYRCAVGRDRCIAATHQLSLRLDTCSFCNQRTAIDPECSTTVCIKCWRGRRLADNGSQ